MPIRLATPADAPGINAIYRPFVSETAVSFELDPPSNKCMARRVAETLKKLPWLVNCCGERVLGYVYASQFRARPAYQWAVETAVYVDLHSHRTGIGRGLYQQLFAILRRQGYYTAYAGITLPNVASIGLHQNVGFEPIGIYRYAGYKFGAWHDVGWWQKSLNNYAVPPNTPRPLPEVGFCCNSLILK
jgi:L-amino acid N-acyltransferase YncA